MPSTDLREPLCNLLADRRHSKERHQKQKLEMAKPSKMATTTYRTRRASSNYCRIMGSMPLVYGLLTFILIAFAPWSSSSSWQAHARKTNWDEINTDLNPRTKGLSNYESSIFKRSSNVDSLNETLPPVAADDKDNKEEASDKNEERKGDKPSDGDVFFTEQGKKISKSSKVTPPPKSAPKKEASSPAVLSLSSAPSARFNVNPTAALDDDIFFVVPPSKKKDRKPVPPTMSPEPTMSMVPSYIPSISPAPTFSVQPTNFEKSKSTPTKSLKTASPAGPDGGSKKTKNSKQSKNEKEQMSKAKGVTHVPPPSFKDGQLKFTMKKSKANDGSEIEGVGGKGGKSGMKVGGSSKAKLKKSKSSKSVGSEAPSVAPGTNATGAPMFSLTPVVGPSASGTSTWVQYHTDDCLVVSECSID